MKKDKTMQKTNFVKGAFIATFGIVITKILGILYVIPFHAIIGERGGALYGYAYTIYLVFMSLSSAGIPLAISKVISEYQTLGFYQAKKRAFIIGKKIAWILGMICFILLQLFAPILAKFILGDLTGGNTIQDICFVIRIISTAILIVPILSIYRGYFEGHRFMSPPSISQVIEQIVRVFVIVVGSFFVLKVFQLSLTTAVGVALFGATLGALVSYFYLVEKRYKNKKKFDEKIRPVNEPMITNQQIFRKIVIYAIPFILIDIFKSMYNYIDMVSVVKGLVLHAGFSTANAEVIMSMLSTWANKFNMIVLSISTGVIISLIPNLTKALVLNQYKEVNDKINQSLSMLLFFTVPMTIGLSFLSNSVWILFYGSSKYGPSVLSYYIFVGLITGVFTATISIIQVLKDYKTVFISLLIGVILKAILTTNLIIAFYQMGIAPYYGVITASIVGYFTSFMICLIVLHKKYHVNYEKFIQNFMDILCGCIIMIFLLFLLKFIIPMSSNNRVYHLFIVFLYTIVGSCIYFFYTYRMKTIKRIFGDKFNYLFKRKKKVK